MIPIAERTIYYQHSDGLWGYSPFYIRTILDKHDPVSAYGIGFNGSAGIIPLPRALLLGVLSRREEFPVTYIIPGVHRSKNLYEAFQILSKLEDPLEKTGVIFTRSSEREKQPQEIRDFVIQNSDQRTYGVTIEDSNWVIPIRGYDLLDVLRMGEIRVTRAIKGVDNLRELRRVVRDSRSKAVTS
jgi:hypothetical protein